MGLGEGAERKETSQKKLFVVGEQQIGESKGTKQTETETERKKMTKEINGGRDRYKGFTLCEPAPGGLLTAWTMLLSSVYVCVRVCDK